MKVDRSYYITIEELLNKIKNNDFQLFVFGTSKLAEDVSAELNYYNVKIQNYLDNNKNKWGTYFNNIEVLDPNEILKAKNPFVIMGSSYIYDIDKQLKAIGIKEVYVLCDTFKYSYTELENENKLLEKYNNDDGAKNSGNVLIKAFDGLGDNILKLGIYRFLANMENGHEKFHIIVHKRSNYELLSIFFKNVTLIDEKKYLNDSEYRIKILEEIDKQYYNYDINFLEIFYYEFMNKNNTNINTSYRNRILSDRNYFLNGQIDLVQSLYNIPKDYSFCPKGLIDGKIINVEISYEIIGKYICIGLGHDSEKNYYSPENWAKVIDSLSKFDYKIVLLGYGKDDENIIYDVLSKLETNKNIVNLCSKLSILQTLKVIKDSELYIGLDSGLSHCAYVLDKKAVTLMGGTQYYKYMHDDPKMIYVSNKLDCYYCIGACKYGKETKDFAKCVSGIKPEKIIEAVYRLIG